MTTKPKMWLSASSIAMGLPRSLPGPTKTPGGRARAGQESYSNLEGSNT